MRSIAFSYAVVFLAAAGLASASRTDRAHAQGSLATVNVENGHCYTLIVAGHDVSISCSQSVVHETSNNGRIGFTFAAPNFATVSFSGAELREENLAAGRISQPIDYITFRIVGLGALQKTTPATGACVYSDRSAGPALLECIATSPAGAFAARFLSDGQDLAGRNH